MWWFWFKKYGFQLLHTISIPWEPIVFTQVNMSL
jgi:hypothetical protein